MSLPHGRADNQQKDMGLDDSSIALSSGCQNTPDRLQASSPLSESRIPDPAFCEGTDDVYNRFSPRRKTIITAVLSWCGFMVPISSTAVLSFLPEVAAQYNTTGNMISLSNSMYLVMMSISPMFWGPISQVYGRRWISLLTASLFTVFSIATAVAPDLASYFIFRMLTAFQGTSFLVTGSSCIGDIYRPTERATALGWFLGGINIGPAIGPVIGGVIVTYKSWRDHFWLQSALGGFSTVLVFFLLPETIHKKRSVDFEGLSFKDRASKIWQLTNPARVIVLFRFPNLLIVGLASSALVWNMYSLLTPIRYVINPRFHLTSPLQSGLFYLAPGLGYTIGTFFGGRYADHVVKKWIIKRGERVPEDRLRSAILWMGFVVPGSIIVYGWAIENAKGGIPLPVLCMLLQGVAQLMCFPSLNAYCLDIMQDRSSEVVAGNYLIRYSFGALGSAVCLPAIEQIGVGWFSTISALFIIIVTALVQATIVYGRK